MRVLLPLLVALALAPVALAQTSPPVSSTTVLKSETSAKTPLKFTRTLKKGMSGSDVKALQEYLKLMPDIYPDGSVTGYFGAVTETAVKKFQVREALVKAGAAGYGAVGVSTLAKIEAVLAARALASAKKQSEPLLPATSTSSTASAPAAPAATTSATSTAATVKPAAPARDTEPPVRSGTLPPGTLPEGTPSIKISLTTNEPSHCYWSNSPNTPYESMGTAFQTTGGRSHSSLILISGVGDYAFFAKCRDRYLNANTSDYPILFSTERRNAGGDTAPPRVFMSFPTHGDTVSEGFVNLAAAAADNAGVAAVNFYLNRRNLDAEDTAAPYAVTLSLKPGTYTAQAVARDIDANTATSAPATFTVTAKVAAAIPRFGRAEAASSLPSPFYWIPIIAVVPPQLASASYAFSAVFDLFFGLFRASD